MLADSGSDTHVSDDVQEDAPLDVADASDTHDASHEPDVMTDVNIDVVQDTNPDTAPDATLDTTPDASPDVVEDAGMDTEPDTPMLNACDGTAPLEGEPGTSCGTCDTGTWICASPNMVTCLGDEGDSVLNECGGCGELEHPIGASCGTCNAGVWECRPAMDGRVRCDDPGDDARNVCGGCEILVNAPGDSCGRCELDEYVCDGEALVCSGNTGGCCTIDADCTDGEHCSNGWCAPEGLAFIEAGSSCGLSLEHDLYASETEMSLQEWQALSGGTPRNYVSEHGDDVSQPVAYVTFHAIFEIANRRSVEEGLTPCFDLVGCENGLNGGNIGTSSNNFYCSRVSLADGIDSLYECDGYRPPTTEEWEYIARAGTCTAWFCGDDALCIDSYAWFGGNTSGLRSIATRDPNPWGLYDTMGNVWEMTINPSSLGSPQYMLGGSYRYGATEVQPDYRGINATLIDMSRFPDVGIRLVRTLLD